MGLDMYLQGERYLGAYDKSADYASKPLPCLTEETYRLGYWRKHPNLHGYIVQQFAGGDDKCQRIDLNEDDIGQIITAIKSSNLPSTTGFFFGASELTLEEREEDIKIFADALVWLKAETDPHVSRSIFYQASW